MVAVHPEPKSYYDQKSGQDSYDKYQNFKKRKTPLLKRLVEKAKEIKTDFDCKSNSGPKVYTRFYSLISETLFQLHGRNTYQKVY